METKQDLTKYSENELSLHLFNDEYLYKARKQSHEYLRELLEEIFIFTEEQFDVLIQDIEDDLNEV